jgi:hypothetical protein
MIQDNDADENNNLFLRTVKKNENISCWLTTKSKK